MRNPAAAPPTIARAGAPVPGAKPAKRGPALVSLSSVPRVEVAHPHVAMDPAVLGGSPFVRGSKVPVRRLWRWYRGGASVETLIQRYPNLGPARICDALSFAFDNHALIRADIAKEDAFFAAEASGARANAPPAPQLELFATKGRA